MRRKYKIHITQHTGWQAEGMQRHAPGGITLFGTRWALAWLFPGCPLAVPWLSSGCLLAVFWLAAVDAAVVADLWSVPTVKFQQVRSGWFPRLGLHRCCPWPYCQQGYQFCSLSVVKGSLSTAVYGLLKRSSGVTKRGEGNRGVRESLPRRQLQPGWLTGWLADSNPITQ